MDETISKTLTLRAEQPQDLPGIHQLTRLAFSGRPYAGGDEQDVIDRLRRAGALTLSLVAEVDGQLVGQVTFSPAQLSDGSGPWFALGPVSVLPEFQGKGIGAALIRKGLTQIQAGGALGCILTGNPDYYRRFGFELAPRNTPAEEAPEYFMLKLLGAPAADGVFAFHPGFYGE